MVHVTQMDYFYAKIVNMAKKRHVEHLVYLNTISE